MLSADLLTPAVPGQQRLGPEAVLLRGQATESAPAILAAIEAVIVAAPLRHMQTPGGYTMSAAMSNCGALGWVSDTGGYRYDPVDPLTGRSWPAMPDVLQEFANRAAGSAGFADFAPDACLINCYEPGARMSLHQDKDERDFSQPIVSLSLGLPMTFLFGGLKRKDRPERILLNHGDVVVWGGVDRLRYHGVAPLKEGRHALLGRRRINLTFRRAD
jgi:DNA oxidative demethylase